MIYLFKPQLLIEYLLRVNVTYRGFSDEQDSQHFLKGLTCSRTSVHISLLSLEAQQLGGKEGKREGNEEIVLFSYKYLTSVFATTSGSLTLSDLIVFCFDIKPVYFFFCSCLSPFLCRYR